MGKRVITLLIWLAACGVYAQDKYLIIGIDTDATAHDKQALLAVIVKYLDPYYTADKAFRIYKISDPTQEAIVGAWDNRRKFPFTRTQAETYFANHAADFNNVNKIKLIGADKKPIDSLTALGWAKQ